MWLKIFISCFTPILPLFQVLKELNISHVSNSLIGDKVKRGISGGERKRVSIGVELCYSPMCLLLDGKAQGYPFATSNDTITPQLNHPLFFSFLL